MTLRQATIIEQVHQDAQTVNTRQAEQKRATTQTIGIGDLKPNHRVFEWDMVEGIIQPAIIVEQTVMIGKRKTFREYIEFETRPNCKYVPALNAQNAERRLKKNLKMKK